MLWNDTFSCDIPHIDAQHKGLFDHIELLGTMHGDISRIPKTIDFLETYTQEHFADEESLHGQTHYPYAVEHRRLHQEFLRKVGSLKSDYEACGHSLSTLMDMNRALVDWLKTHILNADKKFSAFFLPLPAETKRTLRLPFRPWIPESAQSMYRRDTGMVEKPAEAMPVATRKTTSILAPSWSETMLCGIPAIDEQHMELFRQIDILKNKGNKDRVPGVLRFLADYVVKHFNDEESLHLRSRYPEAAPHRKVHQKFIETFQELKAKYDQAQGDFSAVMEINKVVFEWLREHILKTDMLFAKYYLALPENQ